MILIVGLALVGVIFILDIRMVKSKKENRLFKQSVAKEQGWKPTCQSTVYPKKHIKSGWHIAPHATRQLNNAYVQSLNDREG
jgi:hypothetical protein